MGNMFTPGCCCGGCDIFSVPNLIACKPGSLSTRTSDTVGVLTMASGHGINTGDTLNISWVGGSSAAVIVGTVSGDSVPITLGTGVLPAASTAITVLLRRNGSLLTRTSDTVGSLSLQNGHEFVASNIVSIYWSGGSRDDVQLGRAFVSGTLTTRTSDTVGTLTMSSGHGIVTGDILDISWSSSARVRVNVTAGTVSGNSVPISLGAGDALPSTSTSISVTRKNVMAFSLGDGDSLPTASTSMTILQLQSGTVSAIDGFVAYDTKLPAAGLWQLALTPRFTGDLNTTPAPKITYRLLKDDNSVFAEWFYSRQIVARDSAKDEVAIKEVIWNSATVVEDTSHIRRVAAFSTMAANVLSFSHSIVMRTAYASIQNLSETGALAVAFDLIEDFYQGLPQTAWLDEDEDTQNNTYSGGATLPFSESLAASTGPLRFAVKSEAGTGNSFTLQVAAGKIRQEAIDCESGYYYGSYSQPEKNSDCVLPYVCRVTHPYYMTPMWEVTSATSDVTLATTETQASVNSSCMMFNRYGNISTQVNLVAGGEAAGLGYAYVGQLNYNASDVALAFSLGATTSDYASSLVSWEYVSGPIHLASSYAAGTGPTFRTSSFPYNVTTTVIATDDPCEWLVRCVFSLEAWFVTPNSATFHQSQVTFNGVNHIYIPNPQQSGNTTDSQVKQENYSYESRSATFEKVVPSWLHEPPTLTFTSADLVSAVETWRMLTGFSGNSLVDGSIFNYNLTGRVDFNTEDISTDSIAFTLQAHSSPRVPHP